MQPAGPLTPRLRRHLGPLALCAAALLGWAAPPPGVANTIYKCEVGGKVTFQQSPCASPGGSGPRKEPNLEQLNAEARKRREAAAAQAAERPSPPAAAPAPAPSPRPATASSGYRCDGRTHCSQMTSCAEAKFFLANCPGVEMDGNRDGVPCERQWCR